MLNKSWPLDHKSTIWIDHCVQLRALATSINPIQILVIITLEVAKESSAFH
jgi:hypothetical protein